MSQAIAWSVPACSAPGSTDAVWRYGAGRGEEEAFYACQMRFLPCGRIGGYLHPNERFWSLVENRLRLHDRHGQPTAIFEAGEAGRPLHGVHIASGFALELAPAAPLHRLAGRADAVDPARLTAPRGRRNLVVVRAGPNSLHTGWEVDVDPAVRSWDLCISHFGPEHRLVGMGGDLSVQQDAAGKFGSLWQLFHAASALWDYDRIVLCDDDIALAHSDLQRLFDIAARHRLAIAQPALDEGSHVTHDITRRQPGRLLRFTDFVEPMAPCFESWALRIAVPAFSDAKVGFGLDHLWSFLIGRHPGQMAIVDDVKMVHTRPCQTSYDVEIGRAEEARLVADYGFAPSYSEHGGLGF